MKIKVIAQSAPQVTRYLGEVCQAIGLVQVVPAGKVRLWHDDILDMKCERGEIWNVFTATISDNCQNHIKDFECVPKLSENIEFPLPRAFCALVPPSQFLDEKEVYIIA